MTSNALVAAVRAKVLGWPGPVDIDAVVRDAAKHAKARKSPSVVEGTTVEIERVGTVPNARKAAVLALVEVPCGSHRPRYTQFGMVCPHCDNGKMPRDLDGWLDKAAFPEPARAAVLLAYWRSVAEAAGMEVLPAFQRADGSWLWRIVVQEGAPSVRGVGATETEAAERALAQAFEVPNA